MARRTAPGERRALVRDALIESRLTPNAISMTGLAGNVLAARSSLSLDLTRYKINTLAPESVDVAHRLAADADITFWDNSSDSSYDTVRSLLVPVQLCSP